MPWSTDDIKRLVEVEAQLQNVDPRLALAVAEQESKFDPRARSPKGATGVMQLMPGTAKQLGVTIDDPADNIRGGVTYLKQQLDAFGGDQGMALAAYNAGPGVVKAYGKVPPYKETQGYVSRILGMLAPASAEAATPQAPARSRLDEIEAELARRDAQQAPGATPAPAQPQTPAATNAQPGGSQGAPAPDPSPTAGMRFQALPSIQQLQPAERVQRAQEFAALRPDLQEEFLRSEEPSAASLAVGGGPTRQATPVTDPLALLAVGGRPPARPAPPQAQAPASSTMIEPLREGGVSRLLADQRTGLSLAEHARVGAATGIDIAATAGGAALGGMTAPVTGVVGPIAGAALGGAAGTRLNTALGLRSQETPLIETPYANVYPSDVVGAGLSALFGLPAVVKTVLSRSQAGKAINAADEATTTAYQAWQKELATARAEQQAGRAEAYQAAERRVREAQGRYQTRVEARDQTIAANEQTYQDALAAHRAETQGTQAQYEQAVTGQEQAITQARQVPGRYTPETPSWVLYEKYGDAAKDAVVDLTPAKGALAEVRASRGVLPDGTVRPFPQAVESIAANLEKATGDTSFQTIREELRRLGPLSRSQDGNVRGAAKQLYGIYADVLDASPVANDLLRQANATFRKEMALQDMQEWLRPGHGIIRRDNQGRETINVGALLTRFEKKVGDDSLFRRSFAPDELDAVRQDLGRLAGTPSMPRGQGPPAPGPAPTRKAAPRDIARPRVEMLPGGAGPGRGVDLPAAPQPVTPREALGARPKFLGPRAGEWGAILVTLQALGIPTAPLAAAAAVRVTERQGRWLLANALLSDKGQKVVRAAMDGRGTLNPMAYGALVATLTPEEKKAYERETRKAGR